MRDSNVAIGSRSQKMQRDMHVAELIRSVLRKMEKASLRAVLIYYSRGAEEEGKCPLASASGELCAKAARFMVDVLPALGTRHAVALMRELVSTHTMRILISLPLIALVKPPHPTMLEELKVPFHSRYQNYYFRSLSRNFSLSLFSFTQK